MIAGPAGVHICDSCVSVCKTIIDRELSGDSEQAPVKKQQTDDSRFNLLKPAEITARLDEHIISQDYAKRALAVAVYNHYKRLRSEERLDPAADFADIDRKFEDVHIEKSNILLGPTGGSKRFSRGPWPRCSMYRDRRCNHLQGQLHRRGRETLSFAFSPPNMT